MKVIKSFFLFSAVFICLSLKAQLTFTINNSSGSYSITCKTLTVKLVASSNFSSAVSYTWTSPQLVGTINNSIGITSPGTFTINASSGTLSTSQTLAIGINTTAPSITLTASQPSLTCLNPVSLLMWSSNSPSVSWKWVDGLPQDPMNTTPTYTAGVAPHTYTLIIEDLNNGCASNATINIGDNRFYPVISAPPPFLVTCPDGTVNISPVVSTNSNNVNLAFLWTSPMTATVSGSSTPSLITNAPGIYSVAVTNTVNGCQSKALIYVYACVGLNTYDWNADFRIFPNPVNDKLYFEFDKLLTENIKLSISNTLGQIVYSKNKIDLKQELDLSFLKGGLYYFRLEDGNEQKVFKLIKN